MQYPYTIQVRLSPELRRRLLRLREERGVNVSAWVRRALGEALEAEFRAAPDRPPPPLRSRGQRC